MAVGIGEASAILAVLSAARGVISILDELISFGENCSRLRDGCSTLGWILEQNQDLLKDDPTIEGLAKAIEDCYKYLDECNKKRFRRNPVFEVTFHRRIRKYKGICDDWISKALLSIQVESRPSLTDPFVGKVTRRRLQNEHSCSKCLHSVRWRFAFCSGRKSGFVKRHPSYAGNEGQTRRCISLDPG